jgi:hypothetical protein
MDEGDCRRFIRKLRTKLYYYIRLLPARAKHLSSSENHSCMKFVAEDFNRLRHVACFKMVNHQAIFKNGIHAGLLGELTQYTVIMFGQNVDQYFHGSGTTINPLNSASH